MDPTTVLIIDILSILAPTIVILLVWLQINRRIRVEHEIFNFRLDAATRAIEKGLKEMEDWKAEIRNSHGKPPGN